MDLTVLNSAKCNGLIHKWIQTHRLVVVKRVLVTVILNMQRLGTLLKI